MIWPSAGSVADACYGCAKALCTIGENAMMLKIKAKEIKTERCCLIFIIFIFQSSFGLAFAIPCKV